MNGFGIWVPLDCGIRVCFTIAEMEKKKSEV